MKTIKFNSFFVTALAGIAILTYSFVQQNMIKGKITPASSWAGAWIMVGTDTLRAINLSGTFEISAVPAGTHQLFIDGAESYQDTTIVVVVEEGQETNVGNVHLKK